MDIRIDTNRYSIGAPLPAVRFAPGVIAGQANCASEVSFPSAPISTFGQYPHPPSQASQQGHSCVNFSQPLGSFNTFYPNAAPSSSTFSHQQSTPKKNRNYDTISYQRGYDQNFQRFNPGPSQTSQMAPFSTTNNSNLNQPPFRRCNSMGVASNNSNFRMNAPQAPPPISSFGQQDAYQSGLSQQLPHRDLGRSRGLSSHHKRYVSVGGVQKSKKKYDRKNDQTNSNYRNKPLKDKRSPGFYDSSSMMQRPPKRKWNRNSNEKSKRFCDRSKKSTKWTECNSRDIARVHRNCVENGQPLAPYNTTQFIMNEHMAGKEFDFDESSGQIQHHRRLSEGSDLDETEDYSSPAEDENQYLERQFNEAFQNVHRETLIKKSKDELVTDILVLEKKYTNLNNSRNSSVRTINKNRVKALKHRQTRSLLREMYLRHNKLANSVQSLTSAIVDSQIDSTSSCDNEISLQRVKLEEYFLPDELNYMVQYCLQDSETDDDDDDDDDTSTSSSSSDCDSEYSSSSDSSYGSDCSSDVELEVAGILHDMLDLVDMNFQ